MFASCATPSSSWSSWIVPLLLMIVVMQIYHVSLHHFVDLSTTDCLLESSRNNDNQRRGNNGILGSTSQLQQRAQVDDDDDEHGQDNVVRRTALTPSTTMTTTRTETDSNDRDHDFERKRRTTNEITSSTSTSTSKSEKRETTRTNGADTDESITAMETKGKDDDDDDSSGGRLAEDEGEAIERVCVDGDGIVCSADPEHAVHRGSVPVREARLAKAFPKDRPHLIIHIGPPKTATTRYGTSIPNSPLPPRCCGCGGDVFRRFRRVVVP